MSPTSHVTPMGMTTKKRNERGDEGIHRSRNRSERASGYSYRSPRNRSERRDREQPPRSLSQDASSSSCPSPIIYASAERSKNATNALGSEHAPGRSYPKAKVESSSGPSGRN